MDTMRNSQNLSFFSITAMMLLIIGLTVFSIVRLVPYAQQIFTGSGPMDCECLHHVSFLTNHPYLSGTIVGLFILFSAFLLYFLYRVIKSIYFTRRFIRDIESRIVKPQKKLIEILPSVGLRGKVYEADKTRSEIFCYGFTRPRICISSRLIREVSRNQLRAVLLHEKNHLESFDPLRIFVANIMRKSFPFIPGLKAIIDQFEAALELSADARATNNFKEIKPLGNALVKLIESSDINSIPKTKNLAVTFLSITEKRVDQLINQSRGLTVKQLVPKILITMMILVGILFGMYGSHILIAEASQADAGSSNASCHDTTGVTGQNKTISDVCDYNSMMSCAVTAEKSANWCE